MELNYGDKALT